MLLADNGAEVTKIEPPGGDPFRALHGYKVWNRGKRSAVLDLEERASDRDRVPGVASRRPTWSSRASRPVSRSELGIDYETLQGDQPASRSTARSPATATRASTPTVPRSTPSSRPAPGSMYESRGITGGTSRRLAGIADAARRHGAAGGDMLGRRAPRPGRCSAACRGSSMGTVYLANLGISAALRAREKTGGASACSTSLMQGVLAHHARAMAAGRAGPTRRTSRPGSSTAAAPKGSVQDQRRALGAPVGAAAVASSSARPRATRSRSPTRSRSRPRRRCASRRTPRTS